MTILAIETSCDETAAAIVKDGTEIVSNVVASSQEIHAKYGGIIPEQAAREQIRAIIPVINEALNPERKAFSVKRKEKILPGLYTYRHPLASDIDALAVTVGPGLIGSLLVGVETAKALALAWNKPLVPVNHLVGHIYANWLGGANSPRPEFPAVVLIVSGGHTELVLMENHGKFKRLGGTRDDAAGECFDKCARLLNLGYPGGPAIEAAASKFQIPNSKLNCPVRCFMTSNLTSVSAASKLRWLMS